MTAHTLKSYEDELNKLNEKMLLMASLVEKAVRRSMKSLLRQDSKRAEKVIARDTDINTLELEIDEMTRSILALRQPAARDLRFIIAAIKIVADLERSGDLAEGIAKYMLETEDHPLTHTSTLESMSELVIEQIKNALNAFAKSDLEAALVCIEGNKKINASYKAIQRENLTYMMEDPRQITAGLIVANVSKNLERIGDHAVNVAEMVIYMVKGSEVRHVGRKRVAAIIEAELD